MVLGLRSLVLDREAALMSRTLMGTLATFARRTGSLGLVFLVAAQTVRAERLSITAYTVADGLPHSIVKKIVADSRGFVWFATRRGLARFDGQRFLTYGVQDGLPSPSVNHLLVTSRGAYWVATNGAGVCRLRTDAPRERSPEVSSRHFTICAVGETPEANRVNVLHEDRQGQIWAGSDGGLLRLVDQSDRPTLEPVALDLPERPDRAVQVWAFAESKDGSLWLGTSWGLVRRFKNQTVHYRIEPVQGADHAWAVITDAEDRIWIGHATGLIVFPPDDVDPRLATERARSLRIQSQSSSPRPVLRMAAGDAVRLQTVSDPYDSVFALHRSPDGSIWIASSSGLTHFDGARVVRYENPHRVPQVAAIAEDRAGHIWIAGISGALRLARTGFVTYSAEDGVPPRIRSLFESRSGDLVVSGWPSLHRFDGVRFAQVPLNLSADRDEVDLRAPVLHTRTGEWWVPSRAGLYRFPAVAAPEQLGRVQPTAIYTTHDGLAGDDVYRLFEDSSGNVWIATWAPLERLLRAGVARLAVSINIPIAMVYPHSAGHLPLSKIARAVSG